MSRHRSTIDRRRAEQRGGGSGRHYTSEELAAALWRGGEQIPVRERYTLPGPHAPQRVTIGSDPHDHLYHTQDARPFGRR